MDTIASEKLHLAGYAFLLLVGPALLAMLGMIPSGWLNRYTRKAATTAIVLAAINAVFAVLALFPIIEGGSIHFKGGGLTVYLDGLAGPVYLLVSVLLLVVIKFSREYLAGDPQQGRYYKWLCLTGAAVLLLIISGNFLQFTLCWMAVSLFLHQLLVFYRNRPGALLAARKKFIISRLGDLCLIASLVLVFKDYGTWDIRAIFAQASSGSEVNTAAHGNWTAFLLVLGALLKSAQFPFHSWLPDTMETPTPVSALMHAGIINAGGFLVMRFSPLISDVPLANQLLVLIGSFTALFGAFVMLTQASVKRGLAFSTVSQMGFMMLECGLGAYSMALLHLIAHSCYKAHAFLRSGSAVKSKFINAPALRSPVMDLGLAVLCLPISVAIYLATGALASLAPSAEGVVLASMIVTGVSFWLWSLWRLELNRTTLILGLLIVGGITGLYHLLHQLFGGFVHHLPTVSGVIPMGSAVFLAGCFMTSYLLCVGVMLRIPSAALERLYIHARNGFYINTLANRLIQNFWPVKL